MPDRPGWRRDAARLAWPAAALAGVTALLLLGRGRFNKAHVALAYLLVVLLAAANGGRRVGLAAAGIAFLAFNWFFLPPYGTLRLADPLDWFVLAAFLATSVVASHLFHRVQQEAGEARARTREVSSLASLGAEAMRAPMADAALQALADGVCRTLEVDSCVIVVSRQDAEGREPYLVGSTGANQADSSRTLTEAHLAMERATGMVILPDGVSRLFPAVFVEQAPGVDGIRVARLVLPLSGTRQIIGAVEIGGAAGIMMTPDFRRVLAALLYYVALAADRLRLERATRDMAALREADRLKNALLASVSHDLRTPLTTITALAHELGTFGDERSEIIAEQAERLNRYVRDLLDLSRLASGGMPGRGEVVPVDELISTSLQQVEGAFGDRRIDVHLDEREPLLLGRCDPSQAVRIVVNLLENAHKYAPIGTPIDLSATRAGPWLVIEVADRGPGVPAVEVARIFEPLYRPAAARPDAGSAGLGLAIARGFAQAQHGSIEYAPRPGGGSVFTVRLPGADLTDIPPPPRVSNA